MFNIEAEKRTIDASEFNDYGIHIPKIMPDEFFEGYFERFSKYNGFKSSEYAYNFLKENIEKTYPNFKYFTPLWFFAKAFKMSVYKLMLKHTLSPINRSFNVQSVEYKSEDEAVFRRFRKNILGNPTSQYYFCKECVKEDMKIHKFSYWRRLHNLPGIESCIKHNTPLQATIDSGAFKKPPDYYIENKLSKKVQASAPFIRSAFYQRYSQLVSDYFDLDFQLEVKITMHELRKQLYSTNSPLKKYDSYQIMMNDIIPTKWARRHFPSIIKYLIDRNSKNMYFDISDCRGSPSRTIINSLLTIATIYENVDDALIKLKNAHNCSPPPIKFT